MLARWAKNPYAVGGAVVLILALGLFLAGRWTKRQRIPKRRKLPNNGSGIPKGWSEEALVKETFDAFDGIFTNNAKKLTVIGKLLGLTDDQLVAVYNRFNDLHTNRGDGTLYDWINDEWSLGDYPQTEQLLDKMRNLELI